MDPALALPSYRVYKGSLVALLVGSVVAMWLLVLPPASADLDGPPDSIARFVNTPTAAPPTPTPEATAAAPATPAGTPEAGTTATPSPTPATATPTATATAPEPTIYTVQSGDTLFAIAERFAPPGVDVTTFANRIVAANNLSDAGQLSIGQQLTIPND